MSPARRISRHTTEARAGKRHFKLIAKGPWNRRPLTTICVRLRASFDCPNARPADLDDSTRAINFAACSRRHLAFHNKISVESCSELLSGFIARGYRIQRVHEGNFCTPSRAITAAAGAGAVMARTKSALEWPEAADQGKSSDRLMSHLLKWSSEPSLKSGKFSSAARSFVSALKVL